MLSVAWAPDGLRLAVGGGEDFLGYTRDDPNGPVVTHQVAAIVEAASGEVVREVPHGRSVWSLAWSPDGALLALGERATRTEAEQERQKCDRVFEITFLLFVT